MRHRMSHKQGKFHPSVHTGGRVQKSHQERKKLHATLKTGAQLMLQKKPEEPLDRPKKDTSAMATNGMGKKTKQALVPENDSPLPSKQGYGKKKMLLGGKKELSMFRENASGNVVKRKPLVEHKSEHEPSNREGKRKHILGLENGKPTNHTQAALQKQRKKEKVPVTSVKLTDPQGQTVKQKKQKQKQQQTLEGGNGISHLSNDPLERKVQKVKKKKKDKQKLSGSSNTPELAEGRNESFTEPETSSLAVKRKKQKLSIGNAPEVKVTKKKKAKLVTDGPKSIEEQNVPQVKAVKTKKPKLVTDGSKTIEKHNVPQIKAVKKKKAKLVTDGQTSIEEQNVPQVKAVKKKKPKLVTDRRTSIEEKNSPKAQIVKKKKVKLVIDSEKSIDEQNAPKLKKVKKKKAKLVSDSQKVLVQQHAPKAKTVKKKKLKSSEKGSGKPSEGMQNILGFGNDSSVKKKQKKATVVGSQAENLSAKNRTNGVRQGEKKKKQNLAAPRKDSRKQISTKAKTTVVVSPSKRKRLQKDPESESDSEDDDYIDQFFDPDELDGIPEMDDSNTNDDDDYESSDSDTTGDDDEEDDEENDGNPMSLSSLVEYYGNNCDKKEAATRKRKFDEKGGSTALVPLRNGDHDSDDDDDDDDDRDGSESPDDLSDDSVSFLWDQDEDGDDSDLEWQTEDDEDEEEDLDEDSEDSKFDEAGGSTALVPLRNGDHGSDGSESSDDLSDDSFSYLWNQDEDGDDSDMEWQSEDDEDEGEEEEDEEDWDLEHSSEDSDGSGYNYFNQPYDSNEDDEDFVPSSEEDALYIGRGKAKVYDIDDNDVCFDSDAESAQIVEVTSDARSKSITESSDNDVDEVEPCPELVPIYTPQGELIDSPDKIDTPKVSLQKDEPEQPNDNELDDIDDAEVIGESEMSNYRFYNAVDQRMAILVLKQPLFFFGHFSVQPLYGEVEVMGYRIRTSESQTIYAARGYHQLNLTPHPTPGDYKRKALKATLHRLVKHFRDSHIQEVIDNFDPAKSVILLMRAGEDNVRVATVSRYLQEHIVFLTPERIPLGDFYTARFLLNVELSLPSTRRTVPLFQQNPEWDTVKIKPTSRVIVLGGRHAGKSTLCQYLINKHIQQFGRVVLIDLDIGQPLVYIPETASVTVLERPLLGVGCFQRLATPRKCCFFGSLNVVSSPLSYIRNVRHLLAYCKDCEDLRNVPWIVNTMGYTTGFGEELTAAIVRLVQPTDVIQLLSKMRSIPNYAHTFDQDFVNRYSFNILIEEVGKERVQFNNHLLPVRYHSRGKKLPPPVRRDMVLLAHLADILGDTNEWFTSVRPVRALLDELQVLIIREDCKPTADMLRNALNAVLVYLCNEVTDKGLYECVGVGIVRGIDPNNNIYLLHSLNEEALSKLRILALGSSSLPQQVMLKLDPKLQGTIPYVYNIQSSPPVNRES